MKKKKTVPRSWGLGGGPRALERRQLFLASGVEHDDVGPARSAGGTDRHPLEIRRRGGWINGPYCSGRTVAGRTAIGRIVNGRTGTTIQPAAPAAPAVTLSHCNGRDAASAS